MNHTMDIKLQELSSSELFEINGGGAASNVVNGTTGAALGATGVSLLKGAKNGASIGRFAGPWGIIGGAVVGAAVGIYLSN